MVRFTKDGRSLSSDEFAEELMKEALRAGQSQIREQVEEKLRDIRCPDHPRACTVSVAMQGTKGTISVKTCCEKVDDEVKETLRREGIE
jgi:hypothetical protein